MDAMFRKELNHAVSFAIDVLNLNKIGLQNEANATYFVRFSNLL